MGVKSTTTMTREAALWWMGFYALQFAGPNPPKLSDESICNVLEALSDALAGGESFRNFRIVDTKEGE